MKLNIHQPRLFVTLILLTGFILSGNMYADDYKEFANKIRQEMWSNQRPEFENYTVPEEYKDESAVILALYEEIVATGKSKVRFDALTIVSLNKELNYSQTYRKMIRLNDKTALEDNSEISYTEQQTTDGIRVTARNKVVVGVRIIKPDGTISEVDMDEAVSVTEGKKDKESHKKLAIPNLQVGDILDYFIYEEGRVDYANIPPRDFYLAGKYPILSYAIHCEVNPKLTTEYRSINGAPDFAETTTPEGNYMLDIHQTNIEKIKASSWISPLRQIPAVRLAIYYHGNKYIYKPASHRSVGLHKNLSTETILNDTRGAFALSSYYYSIKPTKKQAKKYFKSNPNLTDEEKAEYLYYGLLENVYSGDYYFRLTSFIESLRLMFESFKIDHKLGFVTDRFDARSNELSVAWDVVPVIIVGESKVLSYPYNLLGMRYSPSHEGEPIHTVKVLKLAPKTAGGILGKYGMSTYPVSSPADNMDKTILTVDFSTDDLQTLILDKEEYFTGDLRRSAYPSLIFKKEKFNAIAKYLGKQTEFEELERKNKQKRIEVYQAEMERDNKEREDNLKELIAGEYDTELKELFEYSFPAVGVTPDQPQVTVKAKFSLDGFVKRAGNNYILEAGKLIGSQIVMDDEDRARNIDAYLSTARTFQHEIKVNIPEGYTVEGLDKLNMSMENQYGKFVSNVSQSDNVLTITAEKTYKTNFVPVEGWADFVKMFDAANDFYTQSVVLRKL